MERRIFLRNMVGGFGGWTLRVPARLCGQPQAAVITQQDYVLRMLAAGRDGISTAVTELASNPDSRIREVSAYVIGGFGDVNQADALLQALGDNSERVCRAAIAAAQKVLNPNVVGVQEGDTAILPRPGKMPPNLDNWRQAVRKLLRHQSPLVRGPAALTLGWLEYHEALPELEACLDDPIEPVRFQAATALRALTGKTFDIIRPRDFIRCEPPLIAVGQGQEGKTSPQLGQFLRTAFFERQGKFTFPGGIPARHQTIASVWWKDDELRLMVDCEDSEGTSKSKDNLTLILKPRAAPELYHFRIAADGASKQWIASPGKPDQTVNLDIHATVERSDRGWQAQINIPFRIFGMTHVPLGETWGANIIRVESEWMGSFRRMRTSGAEN